MPEQLEVPLFLAEFRVTTANGNGGRPTEATKSAYRYMLGHVNDHLQATGQTLADFCVVEFTEYAAAKGWGGNMQHSQVCALKAYIRWAAGSQNKLGEHPLLEFSVDAQDRKPNRKKLQRKLMTQEKVRRLIEVVRTTGHRKYRRRNVAIILTLWDSWLRLSEILQLEVEDVEHLTEGIPVATKATNGHGKQDGWAEVSPMTVEVIRDWLKDRQKYFEVDPNSGPLFVSLSGGLTRDGLRCMMRKLSKRAGFAFSAHDFRRGGASDSASVLTIREMQSKGNWKRPNRAMSYARFHDRSTAGQKLWGNGREHPAVGI